MGKKTSVLAFLLALTLSLSGCGAVTEDMGVSPADADLPKEDTLRLDLLSDPYLPTAGVSGDTVGATLGDYEITMDDLLYWLNYGAEQYQEAYLGSEGELPWEEELEGQTWGELLMENALETAALYRLIPEVAQREGVSLSQEEKDFLTQDLAASAQQLGGQERLDYAMWYALHTQEQYARSYQAGALYQGLRELYYGENSGNYPTDAQVRSFMEQEGYYRIKYILVEEETLGETLLEQLRASDDPLPLFDRLLEEYSQDATQKDFPNGQEFTAGSGGVAEVEAAALALKEGEISPLVPGENGYYLILRLPADLDSLREELIAQEMAARLDKELAELTLEARPVWTNLDPAAFREQVLLLQRAVWEEMQGSLSQFE